MSNKPSWRTACSVGDIPLREGRRVVFQGQETAVFNLGEEYLAVENRCPHKAGPLADGIVSGKAVFCPLHNWKIDLTTGQVIANGEGSVKTCSVRVQDGKIQVAR